MSFITGDKIVVKDLPNINPLYHGCSGTIEKWAHSDVYKVNVLGKNIVLREKEMLKNVKNKELPNVL